MLTRRGLIGQVSVAALPLAQAAAAIETRRPVATGNAEAVRARATRAELAAAGNDAADLEEARLTEPGREGSFIFHARNMAAEVRGDPLQGLYVAPANDPSGRSGAWERIWDRINGYPEWFGAAPDRNNVDSTPALRACNILCPVTNLGQATYFIDRTLVLDTPFRTFRGVGAYGKHARGTVLMATFANADALQIGPTAKPGSPADFLNGIVISDLSVERSVKRVPTAGSQLDGIAGVRCQWLLRSFVTNVIAREFSIGFKIFGLVYVKIRDCAVLITENATSPKNDSFVGFMLNSPVALQPGYPGGNASLFIESCSVIGDGAPAISNPIGLLIRGAFCDTYLRDFETANIAKGIVITGLGENKPVVGSNGNLHIIQPVLDQCTVFGIEIERLAPTAAVEIIDPYIVPGAGATAGIFHHNCAGQTTLTGGQINCVVDSMASGTCRGIQGELTSGFMVTGTKIIESAFPVFLNQARHYSLDLQIENSMYAVRNPAGAAVSLTASELVRISGSLKGKAEAFRKGVIIDGAGNARITVDPTLYDPAAIVGGASAKLSINNRPVTRSGAYTGAGITDGAGTIAVTGVLG